MAPWSRFGFASPPANGGRSALGGTDAGRPVHAISGRRGGVRLVARRLAARLPYRRIGRSAVRFGWHDALSADRSLPRPRACILTFRCGRPTIGSSTSSTARFPTNWTSGASNRRADRRNGSRRTTDIVSHPVLLNRRTLMYLAERSRRIGTLAVQHRRGAPHSSPADFWSGPVHVAGRHGRRQAPGGHPRKSQRAPSGECGSVIPPPSLCRRCESL